ncbi:MAG: hypothetical protein ABFD64_10595 [Armatimonadota bacterium]
MKRFMPRIFRAAYWKELYRQNVEYLRGNTWKLDVLPTIHVLLAIALPWVHRQETLAHLKWRFIRASTPEDAWFVYYFLGLIFIIWPTLRFIKNKHNRWVRPEPSKVKYKYIPGELLFLILFVWLLPARVFPSFVMLYWWVFSIVSILLQTLIRYLQPSVPLEQQKKSDEKPDLSEPAPLAPEDVDDIQPGQLFYYRELDFNFGLGERVLFLIMICSMAAFISMITNLWWIVFIVFALPILLIVFSRIPIFIVSNERILAQETFEKIDIKISEVVNCGISEKKSVILAKSRRLKELRIQGEDNCQEALDLLEDVKKYLKRKILLVYTTKQEHPYLEIETKDGYIYSISVKNPEAACKLINTAIAARQKSESDDI